MDIYASVTKEQWTRKFLRLFGRRPAAMAMIATLYLSLGCELVQAAGNVDPVGPQPVPPQAAGDNSNYFSVRPDLRKCASPLCGGVFVQRVNRLATRCADGRLRAECYVAEVDISSLDLTPDEEGSVRTRIQDGTVLLKGRLTGKPFAPFGDLGVFDAAEVWQAATDARPTGSFFRALDSGQVCFAAPCLSFREFRLNTFAQRDIAGVELSRVGAGDSQLLDARAALLTPDGILVAGIHTVVSGPAGDAPALVASQFYLPVQSGKSR